MPRDNAPKSDQTEDEAAETQPSPSPSEPRAIPFWMWCALAVTLLFALYTIGSDLKQRAIIRQLQVGARQQTLAQEKVAEELALTHREALILTDSHSIKIALLPAQKGRAQFQATWHPALGLVLLGQSIPVPADRTLQLWFIPQAKRAQPIPSRTFEPDTNGKCDFVIAEPPSALGNTKTLAITQEPKGGSPQPTATPTWVGVVRGK